MAQVLLLVAAAWGLLTLVGVAVLVAVRPGLRAVLLPAAPVVGAAFLVVVLHGTGSVLSVRSGVVVAGVLLVGLVALGVRRGLHRPFVTRASLACAAAGLVVALPFLAVALGPSATVGDSRVVSATQSNDGVWYVSVSSWLTDHAILDVPDIGAGPTAGAPDADSAVPGDGPAVSALTFPLRVGQELVQAALNVVTGTSPVNTFTPWTAAWLLLVPGSCITAAGLWGLRRWTGLAAGVVVVSSALLVQQYFNQNAASVLGIAMVPLALAACVAALERRNGMPLVLGALMLSGLVGTYSEFSPFLAPAVAGAVVLRRRGLVTAIGRAAGLVGLAVLLAPLAWWRAVMALISVRGGAADALGGPFLDVPVGVAVNRLVGVGPLGAALEPSTVGLVLAALVVVGAAAAVVLGPHRGTWIGLLVVGIPFIGLLTVNGLGYTQRRAIEISVPLLLVMAVFGWGALVTRLGRAVRPAGEASAAGPPAARRTAADWRRAVVPVVAVVALVPVAVWAGVNARSSAASVLAPVDLQARHVDTDFSDAVGWIQDVGGTDGADVSVAVPNFFDQQWLTLSLEDETDVEYPTLRADYFRTQSFWTGGVDRYWLVGNGVQVDADPGAVLYANDRFRLLDLDRGAVAMAVPFGLDNWNTGVRPDGGFTTLGDAQVLLVRSAGLDADLEVTFRAESAAPVDVTASTPGGAVQEVPGLTSTPAGLTFDPPAGAQTLVVDLGATVPAGSDARNWIEMVGVERVP